MDLDNTIKVTLDALKNLAFEDDKWVWGIVAEKMEPDQREGRLVISIWPIDAE